MCGENVSRGGYLFGVSQISRRFLILVPSTALTLTLAESRIFTSSSMSDSLLKSCRAYIRINCRIVRDQQLRFSLNAINHFCFGKNGLALATENAPAQPCTTGIRGFVNSVRIFFMHAMFFGFERIKNWNSNPPRFTCTHALLVEALECWTFDSLNHGASCSSLRARHSRRSQWLPAMIASFDKNK